MLFMPPCGGINGSSPFKLQSTRDVGGVSAAVWVLMGMPGRLFNFFLAWRLMVGSSRGQTLDFFLLGSDMDAMEGEESEMF